MCGRFTLTATAQRLQAAFPLFDIPELPPCFNVAPTHLVAAVRQATPETKPAFCQLRWGLIPFWAEDKKIGASLINARADSVATKPAFRDAFKRRRCLVLADGFYEWQTLGKKDKRPYHLRLKHERPFAFAGLWDTWKGDETPLESCTIITTDANDLVRPLHDRMPVILSPRDYTRWLDPTPCDPQVLQEMLQPLPAQEMAMTALAPHVNNVRSQGPECLEPATFA
jgi:putative SOS response-associated peptidase YedK